MGSTRQRFGLRQSSAALEFLTNPEMHSTAPAFRKFGACTPKWHIPCYLVPCPMGMQAQPHQFRALHMRSAGVKLLTLSYSCTGALLGQLLPMLSQPAHCLQEKPDLLVLALLGNLVCLPALFLFGRRGLSDPPVASLAEFFAPLVRPKPVSNRLALLLFTVAWVLGLLLGFWFSVPSKLPH